MRVEEVGSPLPTIHAGSVMMSPRLRSNSVSGAAASAAAAIGAAGGGHGSAAGDGSAAGAAEAVTSMRERIVSALRENPSGLKTSLLETFGENSVVLDAMNKLLSDRMIGLFSAGGSETMIKLVSEQHLADLSYVGAAAATL
jgi:hypothetical protein